jgi:hypothetical protein
LTLGFFCLRKFNPTPLPEHHRPTTTLRLELIL